MPVVRARYGNTLVKRNRGTPGWTVKDELQRRVRVERCLGQDVDWDVAGIIADDEALAGVQIEALDRPVALIMFCIVAIRSTFRQLRVNRHRSGWRR